MKIIATITDDGRPVPCLSIVAGESLEEPIDWRNEDETPRNMDNSVVTCSLLAPTVVDGRPVFAPITGEVSYGAFLDETGEATKRLLVPARTTSTLRPGTYKIRITETREVTEPDTSSSVDILLYVK